MRESNGFTATQNIPLGLGRPGDRLFHSHVLVLNTVLFHRSFILFWENKKVTESNWIGSSLVSLMGYNVF